MTLQTYYPLDEDSGTTAYDVIGANDGTVNGATVNQTGILGTSAYSFDGTDDYISSSIGIDSWKGMSLVMWLDTSISSYPTQDGVSTLSWGENASYGEIVLGIDGGFANKAGHAIFRPTDGSQIKYVTTNNPVNDGNKHQIVATLSEGGNIRIYRDGVLGGQSSFGTMGDPSVSVSVGRWERKSGGYYPGIIDDVRIYDHALSHSEVQYLYDAAHSSEFITEVVSFSSNKKPDLFDLVYSLNNQNITMQVFGSPGTSSEEMKEIVLDGSSKYDLKWSSGHKDFQVRGVLETSDVTVSPTLGSFAIGTALSGFKFEPGKSNINIDPSLGTTKINPS